MNIEEFKQQQAQHLYDALGMVNSPLTASWNEKEQPFPMIGGHPRSASGYPFGIDKALNLCMASERNGFTSPLWLTFDQIKRAGGGVNKGENHTKVLSFTSGPPSKPFLTQYFNADQCYDLPAQISKPLPAPTLTQLDELVKEMGIKVEHDSKAHSVYHSESRTVIQPPKSHYTKSSPFGTKGYYADLIDSVVRDSFNTHPLEEGSEELAKRNLRQELATVFAMSTLGLPRNRTPHMPWMEQFATARPNHREIEDAITDAKAMLKAVGIEPQVIAEPVLLSPKPNVTSPAADPAPHTRQRKLIQRDMTMPM